MKGNRFFHIVYNTGSRVGSVDFISTNFNYVNRNTIVEHVKKTYPQYTIEYNVIITNIIEMNEREYNEFIGK